MYHVGNLVYIPSLTSLVCDSVSQRLTIFGCTAKKQFLMRKIRGLDTESQRPTQMGLATRGGIAGGRPVFSLTPQNPILFIASLEICLRTLVALFLAKEVSQ